VMVVSRCAHFSEGVHRLIRAKEGGLLLRRVEAAAVYPSSLTSVEVARLMVGF
jgi:hypothetical protein